MTSAIDICRANESTERQKREERRAQFSFAADMLEAHKSMGGKIAWMKQDGKEWQRSDWTPGVAFPLHALDYAKRGKK